MFLDFIEWVYNKQNNSESTKMEKNSQNKICGVMVSFQIDFHAQKYLNVDQSIISYVKKIIRHCLMLRLLTNIFV